MKIVIFAGGVGTRMWPLSRENSPKQFDEIFDGTPSHQLKNKIKYSNRNKKSAQLKNSWCGGKSTLRLAFERVAGFGLENIFIQTTEIYRKIIEKQLPELPQKNIFVELARRDVGPAVCFSTNKLQNLGHSGPMAIVWADHLMDRVNEFTGALKVGEKLIEKNPDRFVFMAERPRFANNNLGWIKVGKEKGRIGEKDFFEFLGWKYKPKKALCDQMYKSGEYFWNPGYFITSIEFLEDSYKKLAPEIYKCVKDEKYENCPKLSFDNAIIEKIDLKDAVVIKTNMGWSDPGTLYALKKALEESSKANVTRGKVMNFETTDSLVYNLESGKIVATVGLKGMVVVNTEDAIVVVHKDDVVKISELVKEMKNRKMEKYL